MTLTNLQLTALLLLLLLICLLAFLSLAKPILRYLVNRITDDIMSKLLTDDYDQNLSELFPSIKRLSVLNLIEMSLRAETGKVITRPLGTPKHFPGFDLLMFSPRQMTKLSLPETSPIDMSVILGPGAAKPLAVKIPLLIGGMAYGLALSEEAKLALAKASKSLQTATCSGEGPFLPEEPKEAGKFILQVCHWPLWGARTDQEIATADMLEVQMGQGANVGTARIEAGSLEGRAQQLSGLAPDEQAVSLPAPPGVQSEADWPDFIRGLRQRANGIPIALKIMATDRLEEELSVAVSLGFDVVMIDGAEGGSHAAAPIKQDDFGLPILYALTRAKRYLQDKQISLIVSGGFFTPGQCLKALALGADAVYLGTIPLLALTHNQVDKATPWEPPTTLVYYNSPTKTQLDVDQAATSVANVLTSMVLEMEEAMRALGKPSLQELKPDDLIALDTLTARMTGVKLVSDSSSPPDNKTLDNLCSALQQAHRLVNVMETLLASLNRNHPSDPLPKKRRYLRQPGKS